MSEEETTTTPTIEAVGEKRALAPSPEAAGDGEAPPAEKKAKLDDASESPTIPPTTEQTEQTKTEPPTVPSSSTTEHVSTDPPAVFPSPGEDELAAPSHGEEGEADENDDLSQLELSPQSLAQATNSAFGDDTTIPAATSVPADDTPATTSLPTPTDIDATDSTDIPFPPGYDPQVNGAISQPLQPVVTPTPRRTRRKKAAQLVDEFPDPDSKWSEAATERMIRLFSEFGKRHVLDEKMHNELKMCLDHGGNPAVPLCDRDGVTFFTYLTVAAECGDMELVKIFITQYKEEFSEYDVQTALQAALANREQEIAEYLLKETTVHPTTEAVMELFDVQMNDEHKRKVLPLRAFLDLCLGERYPPASFFVPEVLNRCILAHNVAALELLFEREEAKFLPLLVCATPESKIIRAGRGKVQDIGEGVPPLTYAAVMERPECMEVFLKHGADPNFVWNDMGGSLLHIAGWKSNTELIELLLRYGADPRIPNEQGQTVLSRTKGRRARKAITDMIDQLNVQEGLAPSAARGPPMGVGMHSAPLPSTLSPGPPPMHGGPLPGMSGGFLSHAGSSHPPPLHGYGGPHAGMMGHGGHLLAGHGGHDMHDHHSMAQPLPFDGPDDPLSAPSSAGHDDHSMGGSHESAPRGPVDLMDHSMDSSHRSPAHLSHLTHAYTPPHGHHSPTKPLPGPGEL